MPKKFKGENSKAVEARERKATQRAQDEAKKQAAIDDAFWADDDKHVARKQQRKDDKEKKRVEQLERKKELSELAEQELDSAKSAKPKTAQKLTRAQILADQERLRLAAASAEEKDKKMVHHEQPLAENINQVEAEGDEARTVEDAIAMLSVKEAELERHPEKRVKAAYIKYEEENLPRLKQENSNMRLSQIKQMLKKDWMKSPENPMNQQCASFNTKR